VKTKGQVCDRRPCVSFNGFKKTAGKSLMGSQGLFFFTSNTTDTIMPKLIPGYISSAKPKSVLHYWAFFVKTVFV